jgi:PAS domain S-box-containing protein
MLAAVPVRPSLTAARLAAYRRRLRSLSRSFELLRDQVVITDADAHILYANKATERMTGFSRKEMLGKNPADLWGGHMPAELWKKAWKTLKHRKQPVSLQVLNRRKDGAEVWQSLRISPVTDARGEVRYFIGVEPDISGERRAQEVKEQTLSVIGQDALGPATGVRWLTEVLLAQKGLSTAHRKELRDIRRENARLIAMLGDLVTVNAPGKGYPLTRDADLAMLLRGAADEVRRESPRARFSFVALSAPAPVRTSAALAAHVLGSLLRRAAAAGPSVRVTVDVRRGEYVLGAERPAPLGRLRRLLRRPGRSRRAPADDASVALLAEHLRWRLDLAPADGSRGWTLRIPRPKAGK